MQGWFMLVLSALAAGWGNSLEPVSALSFVSPALAMGSIARLMPPNKETGMIVVTGGISDQLVSLCFANCRDITCGIALLILGGCFGGIQREAMTGP